MDLAGKLGSVTEKSKTPTNRTGGAHASTERYGCRSVVDRMQFYSLRQLFANVAIAASRVAA